MVLGVDEHPGAAPGRGRRRRLLFVDRDEFERSGTPGGFLEWFQVYDDLKGTPLAPVEEHLAAGDDVAARARRPGRPGRAGRCIPTRVLVFVKPPSASVQRARLFARDPDADADALERRLDHAEAEEREATDFDAIVVNDDLSRAVDEVAAILKPAATAA